MKILTLITLSVSASLVTATNATWDELTSKINDSHYQNMTSVVVSQNNSTAYEQYFNGASNTTQHDMRSASKSLTSLAVGLGLGEGLIESVDTLVLPVFKDKHPFKNPDPRKTKISIEDFLTMSAPLECDDWNSASRGNEERMYLIEDWSRFILDLPIRGIPPWKKTAKESKYGRAFSYCTGGVQVLTELVERLTKKPMTAYLQEKLFTPLNIKSPAFSQTPLGTTNGGGGAKLTSRDWIKLGQLMLNQGQYQGQSLISADWVKQSLQPRAVIDADRNIEYGYLWWIFKHEVNGKTITSYAASGNGGNYTFITPELNAVTVITSTAYNTNYMHKQSQEIFTMYVLPHLLQSQ